MRSPRELLRRLRGDVDTRMLLKRGLRLGRDVYLGPGTTIDPDFCFLVEIGDEATIAPGVRILAHDASTKRHCGYSRVGRVSIGRRCFVGAGSILLPGVTVGDDAIVGAGSVVRKDVPAGVMVTGNPAVLVGKTEDYVARHRELLERRPRFGRELLRRARFSPKERQRMWRELGNGGGYVH
jgi:maltose O-acetyltransferase